MPHAERPDARPDLLLVNMLHLGRCTPAQAHVRGQVTGGRNGYGAKLANIFSTEFIVETCDGSRQKRYRQRFHEQHGGQGRAQGTHLLLHWWARACRPQSRLDSSGGLRTRKSAPQSGRLRQGCRLRWLEEGQLQHLSGTAPSAGSRTGQPAFVWLHLQPLHRAVLLAASSPSRMQVSGCKSADNWTSITFKPDLAKFGMTHLEAHTVALMRKRTYDLAGVLGKTVKAGPAPPDAFLLTSCACQGCRVLSAPTATVFSPPWSPGADKVG